MLVNRVCRAMLLAKLSQASGVFGYEPISGLVGVGLF